MLGLLTGRFECRRADCFSFRAIRQSRPVRTPVAISAIEVCEIDGEVKGISSFAQDNAGNLYAVEFGGSGQANAQAGRIFRVDPR